MILARFFVVAWGIAFGFFSAIIVADEIARWHCAWRKHRAAKREHVVDVDHANRVYHELTAEKWRESGENLSVALGYGNQSQVADCQEPERTLRLVR